MNQSISGQSNRTSTFRNKAIIMEMAYSGQNPQVMGQSSFYYYNPEPSPETKQYGHFTPQPFALSNSNLNHQGYFPVAPHSYPMPVYSPASISDCSNMSSYTPQRMMTPQASPRAECQKPTIVVEHNSPMLMPLDTSCANGHYMPGTPTLSTSGSAISSPPSLCEFLPTPVSGVFFEGESFNGVKEGCEEEVFSEVLAAGDWTRCGSPPLSPGKSKLLQCRCPFDKIISCHFPNLVIVGHFNI